MSTTIDLTSYQSARSYLASLEPDSTVFLPHSGEHCSSGATAVGVLCGQHPSEFGRMTRCWEWTVAELLQWFPDWSEYTLPLSTDPSSYGNVTPERAVEITERIAQMARDEFPGLNVDIRPLIGSMSVTGPDSNACDRIREWVSDNWTAAL